MANMSWGELCKGSSTDYVLRMGFVRRLYIHEANYHFDDLNNAYDIALNNDGEWWVLPYLAEAESAERYADKHLGPFKDLESARTVAEMLMVSGLQVGG